MAEPDQGIISQISNKNDKDIKTLHFIFCISILVPIFAWLGIFSLNEPAEIWFQRSGSLVVCSSLYAEIILLKIRDRNRPISNGNKTFLDLANEGVLRNKYDKKMDCYQKITYLPLFIGTIIWGYGDLIR